MLGLRCAGCSGGHGESVGALNRHEVHCGTGSPLEGVGTALRTRWRGSPKLKHSESRMAARWGRLDDRLSNGAASKANWKTVHPLRRIGRKGHDGKGTTETEEVPSRYGSPATSTLGTDLPGHGEPQGVLPTAVRTAAAANDETRHGSPAGSTSPRTPQHDVEEMAKQAVDHRASSQGSPGVVPRSR